MTAIETRVFSGHADPADAEWLAFLDEIFRDVTLSGFAKHGMATDEARRLVSLLAMARKLQAHEQEALAL